MKINTLTLSLLLTGTLGLAACNSDDSTDAVTVTTPKVSDTTKVNHWFESGAAQVAATAADNSTTGAGTARNIILFVGDGMGVSTITAARIFEGQMVPDNEGGEEHQLSFETFPYTALSKTYNTDAQTPDSAGTMTAMMTGVKSFMGSIAIAEDVMRGDCDASQGKELTSALDLAERAGKATGIISTARITHATPAATYAKSADRDWEHSAPSGCADIARQLVEYSNGDGLDVVLGGGLREFLPNDAGGKREDGRNLTDEWQTTTGGTFVTDRDQFLAVDTQSTNKLLGLFNLSHMDYEADRTEHGNNSEPSLEEMTETAIRMLGNNGKGYFLMVEAGRIDHAHHAGNAAKALWDTIALSRAVKKATELTDEKDTLIIVTADHSHVFTMAGYPRRGNPILGLVENQDGSLSIASDDKPYTTLGYTNGPGAAGTLDGSGERVELTAEDTTSVDFMQQATVPMGSETHAGEDVAIYARGPGAPLVRSTLEQNVIFHVMNYAGNLADLADAAVN